MLNSMPSYEINILIDKDKNKIISKRKHKTDINEE